MAGLDKKKGMAVKGGGDAPARRLGIGDLGRPVTMDSHGRAWSVIMMSEFINCLVNGKMELYELDDGTVVAGAVNGVGRLTESMRWMYGVLGEKLGMRERRGWSDEERFYADLLFRLQGLCHGWNEEMKRLEDREEARRFGAVLCRFRVGIHIGADDAVEVFVCETSKHACVSENALKPYMNGVYQKSFDLKGAFDGGDLQGCRDGILKDVSGFIEKEYGIRDDCDEAD